MTILADAYDRSEADEMLIDAVSRLARNRRARLKAAQELADAILRLDGFVGARVFLDHGNANSGMKIDVQIENKVASISFDPMQATFKVNGQVVDLRYNVLTDGFEGGADHYYAPEPGKPPRRRSALAVIVEAVVSAM